MITADDLFINWARGEWQIGDDPRPLPSTRCASAERLYVSDQSFYFDERFDDSEKVNWYHHQLVDAFFHAQIWLVRAVLISEYIDRYKYYGLKRQERYECIAKKLRLNASNVRQLIETTQEHLMHHMEGKV